MRLFASWSEKWLSEAEIGVKTVKLEEKDYRGILAILWTALTFIILGFAIGKGWSPQEVIALAGCLSALDIVFIKGYFDSKA